ncbi:tetratricopeptide repeat protein [uncultured Draconibacterium sp.]|uniref:tetratricopeptide repeat protein n=1 Tax=uncultured Draconibacterium sp. TaxID=1573823 RepID=UPI00262D9EDC|nr:tetratricopeptide repeat protein [uncultured Draconibacterium sp.]
MAEIIMEQDPDSALVILDAFTHAHKKKKELYYKYQLVKIQAKYKCYKDISNDTLIFTIRDYYFNKNNTAKVALAAYYSGRVYQEQKDYENALIQFFDANKYLEQSGNLNLKGLCQNAIGDIYSMQLLKEKAIIYYKQGKDYFHQAEDFKNEIITCKLIGNCLLILEKTDSAFIYYNEALKLANTYNYNDLEASIRMNIGVAHLEIENWKKAELYFNEAMEHSVDSVNYTKLATNFARLYELQGKNDSAIVFLQRALNYLPLERNNYVAANIYKTWSAIEENRENYKNALNKYRLYNKHLAQIITDNKNSAILEIKEKYNLQLVENQNKQLLIERQRLLLLFLLLFILLTILIFYLSRRSVQNRRKLNETEQKVRQLTKLARSFNDKEESFRNVLIRHFDIIKKAALIEGYLKEEERKRGEPFLRKFNEVVYGKKKLNWELLYQTLNNLSNGYFEKFKIKFPQLDESEFRICCLINVNFNNTEIAILLNYSINTVQAKKSIIRKKLGIKTYGNINDFMKETIPN